jgi:hypothetical protein
MLAVFFGLPIRGVTVSPSGPVRIRSNCPWEKTGKESRELTALILGLMLDKKIHVTQKNFRIPFKGSSSFQSCIP